MSDSIFPKNVGKLNLKSEFFTFDDIIEVIEVLNLKDILPSINVDKLFEEVCLVKKNLNTLNLNELSNSNEKYLKMFEHFPDVSNIIQIISYLFSIPATSAFTERVFSVMNAKWSKERGKCSTNLIKSELIIYFNQRESCLDFYDDVKSNNELLKLSRANKKYVFKHQFRYYSDMFIYSSNIFI